MTSFVTTAVHFRSLLLVSALILCSIVSVTAQEPLELDVTKYGVVYRIPEMDQVKVRRNLQYGSIGGRPKHFDLYLPPQTRSSELLPVIVFINGVGDFGDNKLKDWTIYMDWGKLAAAKGFAAINFETDHERVGESIAAMFTYLDQHGKEQGIDATRIGTYACSGNVGQALPYLMGTPVKGIRAAVVYYGAAQVESIRTDLPVMHVLAGRDNPNLLQFQRRLWDQVRAKQAPWAMIESPTLPHAFDGIYYGEESRRIIHQTLAFWESHLQPLPAPPPAKAGQEIVESFYANDWGKAVPLLSEAVKKYPNRADVWGQLGRAHQNTGNFPEAEKVLLKAAELEPTNAGTLRTLGLVQERQQKYAEASKTFQRAIELGGNDGILLATYGTCLIYEKKYEAAVEKLERAVQLIPQNPAFSYNLACAYARLNQKEKALSALEQAVRTGFRDKSGMLADPDLENIRSDAKFQTLANSIGT